VNGYRDSGKPSSGQLYWKAGKAPFTGRVSMSKVLCLIGGVIAALMLLIFGLDLAVKFPFNRIDTTMDIGFVVCALILGYGSWSTMRGLR
jgi:hypothetical protein